MDRRWLLAPLVLLGVLLLAWMVTLTPTVGRQPRASAEPAAQAPVAAAPEAAEAHEPANPSRSGATNVLISEDKRYRLDPNFGKNGRDDTPETATAAKSQKDWQKVIQSLSDQANSTPEATALEAEVVNLYDELVFFRDDPDGKDWLALSQKSMRLNEKIRNVESLAEDADLHDALAGVKATLMSYHAQGQGQQGP